MTTHTVEWAAGFFEGEGYVGFKKYFNKAYNRYYPRLTMSISQTGKEPLDKFQEVFKVGKVLGPYGPYSSNRQPYYQYNLSGCEALEVVEKMLPYLFDKGKQASVAIEQYKVYNFDK